jgi:SpoVK/Ycf46/Vps4 family AAA+-type ATPase
MVFNKNHLSVYSDSVDRPPFDYAGFDKELVELIQNGILQQTPQVQWKDISGLEEAKMLLIEAVILPMEHPVIHKLT